MARRFAAEGADVVLGDIAFEPTAAIVDEIVASGGSAVATRVDGTDEESATAAVALARGRFGGRDGMHVNLATFIDGGQDVGSSARWSRTCANGFMV